jgi:hypothetical protein
MSISAKIFKKYLNTVVTIYSSEDESDFTGFIKKIKNNRAIIITCAHNVLIKNKSVDGEYIVSTNPLPFLCGTFTNILEKGSNVKKNINCSLGILGMDISADIAVLFTYLPSEITSEDNIFYGFKFSKKNLTLKWGDSILFPIGNPVYCIGYSYGNGLDAYSGNCSNNNFIYDPENENYSNLTNQFLTTLSVEQGSSGSPILSEDGKILGMIAWKKINNNYIGGSSQFTLKRVFDILLDINNINTIDKNFIFKNFNGSTGSGWTGLTSFNFVNSKTVSILTNLNNELIGNKQLSKGEGIIVLSIPKDGTYGIEKIPLNHVLNLKTNEEESIKVNDIILEINGKKINYNKNIELINSSVYYNLNNKPIFKVFRPSNLKYYTFQCNATPFPNELEILSSDNTIKLLTTPALSYTKYNKFDFFKNEYRMKIASIFTEKDGRKFISWNSFNEFGIGTFNIIDPYNDEFENFIPNKKFYFNGLFNKNINFGRKPFKTYDYQFVGVDSNNYVSDIILINSNKVRQFPFS